MSEETAWTANPRARPMGMSFKALRRAAAKSHWRPMPKGRFQRRGKKKKASANNGGLEDGEGEREREKGDENNGGEGVTSLVVPSTPKPEGSSSLVVSDTILG